MADRCKYTRLSTAIRSCGVIQFVPADHNVVGLVSKLYVWQDHAPGMFKGVMENVRALEEAFHQYPSQFGNARASIPRPDWVKEHLVEERQRWNPPFADAWLLYSLSALHPEDYQIKPTDFQTWLKHAGQRPKPKKKKRFGKKTARIMKTRFRRCTEHHVIQNPFNLAWRQFDFVPSIMNRITPLSLGTENDNTVA